MWRAIAPLWQYWDPAGHLGDGVPLAGGVSVGPTPEWVRQPRVTQHLSHTMRQRVQHESPLALWVDYEASGPAEADPAGTEGRTSQERADWVLSLASLALWLARPARVGFEVVVHTSDPADPPGPGELHFPRPLTPHGEDADNHLNDGDFERARRLHESLLGLKPGGTVLTAASILLASLTNDLGEVRFLFPWVALEGLFGPEDAREMTYQDNGTWERIVAREVHESHWPGSGGAGD